MSIKSCFLPNHNLIIQVVFGDLTLEAMIAVRQKEIEAGWIGQGIDTLVLMKTESVHLSPTDLRTYTEWAKEHLVPLENSRTAILVDSPNATALSFLFQTTIVSIRRMQVFSTLEPAANWLKVPITAIIEAVPEAQSFAVS